MTKLGATALLAGPATAAAAAIVRERIEAATEAADRLAAGEDAEALHDFRVAIRRLRSALRAYRRWLGRAASRKVRSALRDIGRTTNAGRDAEVQAEWVTREVPNLSEPARPGAEKLARRLRRHRNLRSAELQSTLRSVAGKILKRLDFVDDPSPAFATAYGKILSEHVSAASASLVAVTAADRVEQTHEARIAVKRLRYLLEPLLAELPEAKPPLAQIERLQDLLDELHDAHVLDEMLAEAATTRRAPKRTIAALSEVNAERRAALFAELEDAWLGAAATPFFERIRLLVASS